MNNFKCDNVIKIKNEPYPTLLRTSFLVQEIKKGTKILQDYPSKALMLFKSKLLIVQVSRFRCKILLLWEKKLFISFI
jgi:hypothetical protein